jgi:hypothetical protein
MLLKHRHSTTLICISSASVYLPKCQVCTLTSLPMTAIVFWSSFPKCFFDTCKTCTYSFSASVYLPRPLYVLQQDLLQPSLYGDVLFQEHCFSDPELAAEASMPHLDILAPTRGHQIFHMHHQSKCHLPLSFQFSYTACFLSHE